MPYVRCLGWLSAAGFLHALRARVSFKRWQRLRGRQVCSVSGKFSYEGFSHACSSLTLGWRTSVVARVIPFIPLRESVYNNLDLISLLSRGRMFSTSTKFRALIRETSR